MSDQNKNEVEIFEDEKQILLDHDYDGIRELDHPLPKWWLITFYVTIIFSVPYYLAHTFGGAQSIQEEFKSDVKTAIKTQAEHEAKEGGFNEQEYRKILATEKIDKIAKKTYKRKCKACHGKYGEGGVGPNLTDNFWLHGDGSIATVYKTIHKGVVDKGMPAWGAKLGKKKTYAVLKYVMAFKGTNPENAKEPQGKEYK
ncbi:MAG: c-type cytochrome [Bacteriovoracaceae bacterium]|nr:c-type cytochrome [Bacteriovoracaceae bacterium]